MTGHMRLHYGLDRSGDAHNAGCGQAGVQQIGHLNTGY
jgi:hypothetical protein